MWEHYCTIGMGCSVHILCGRGELRNGILRTHHSHGRTWNRGWAKTDNPSVILYTSGASDNRVRSSGTGMVYCVHCGANLSESTVYSWAIITTIIAVNSVTSTHGQLRNGHKLNCTQRPKAQAWVWNSRQPYICWGVWTSVTCLKYQYHQIGVRTAAVYSPWPRGNLAADTVMILRN